MLKLEVKRDERLQNLPPGVVQAVVVVWHQKTCSGFARVWPGDRDYCQSLFLTAENIITAGEDELAPGKHILCKIGLPDPGKTTPRALEIQIFAD
jgi:hypothetical protein